MTAFTQNFELNAMSANSLNIPNADQSIQVVPIANEINTLTSMNVTGNTVSQGEREFLVNFNLNSISGAPAGGNNDKVVCFAGLNAGPNTSDVWTYYSTMGLLPNSGVYNAIGYEVDLNNDNRDMGANGNLGVDLGGTVSMGVTSTGAGNFTCTAAFLASSQSGDVNHPQWGRGYISAGQFKFCGFQEWSTCPVGLQFDGNYALAAINLTSVYGNPGALGNTALLMRDGQSISWQNNAQNGAVSMTLDGTDTLILGSGATNVLSGAPMIPLSAGFDLGSSGNYWGVIWSPNGVVNPSDLSLKENVAPLPPMCDIVKDIDPISFTWKDKPDTRTHFGFDAKQIHAGFGDNFAGYLEADGLGHIHKDQLIAVLWKTCQELLDRVETLESTTH